MGIEWEGLDELEQAFAAMVTRVQVATPVVVVTIGALLEGRARAKLSETSHARGTPTPSPPGSPPSLISGALRSSFEITPPLGTGSGRWTSVLGPTSVYARIQELGGDAGRDHASHLPPRPYLKPAYDELEESGDAREMASRIWARAVTG
jgi:hypothetical protein